MTKSLRKRIGRKKSINKRRQVAGKPSNQETLYMEAYKLYKQFLTKNDEYEKDYNKDLAAEAQELLKNAVEKSKEAVAVKESDEITKEAAFLVYTLATITDDEEIMYDMWPKEYFSYLKIAADLDHGKACNLYSQLSDDNINSEGYSSSSIAKQAYLDKALDLKNPDALVSHALVLADKELSDMRDALTLLCKAYTTFKYMEISDDDTNLKLGYTKGDISRTLSEIKIYTVNVFRELFQNEMMYIKKDSDFQNIIEFFSKLFSDYQNVLFNIKKLSLHEQLTDEQLEEYNDLRNISREMEYEIFEFVYILEQNNQLTSDYKNAHPSFKP